MDIIIFMTVVIIIISCIGIVSIALNKEDKIYYFHESSNNYYYTTESLSNLSILGDRGVYTVLTLKNTMDRVVVEKKTLSNNYIRIR